ncbi:cytochrome c lysine N-methyltransferase [Yamadazyma tenuis]|uniref:SET domain-containing protein n=1 Tax=Candida tenuis (strain ATCC 10573 / BCRC 21748 / CBS 615 / JCM 9827 / NBRC 10315 / NRRL Y-1498 / VKM Y-70) TaxID=590646 RepID=G3AXG7_CANTC|nr:uncharacterized protein CANTEDRAFT_132629 [Yamadazyma tenuis ATCC 10573]EGV66375.1 hypothetical protein CANTEDRAFT_132629 [Yamadazyma tenuis ATCC 10573]WEJ95507.1 cytochrome c lysine N-methyltransferase [Yamadazyma tenuis]
MEDVIIARIPDAATYNLKNLSTWLEKLKQSSPLEAQVTRTVLSKCEGSNETEIIIDFMFSFMIILSTNEHLQDSPLADIDLYLELLSSTNIDTLDTKYYSKETDRDFLCEVEVSKKEALHQKYNAIAEAVQELGFMVPSFDEYFHMSKVIKSRVLEIPHPVEENEQDFVVNTALVPLLDFANHQEKSNAFFDVDKATGDVVLKYSAPPGLHEVCIQYSDVNYVQQFVTLYSFIPRGKVEVFEIKVDSDKINECINKVQNTQNVRYDLIMKWLEILPTVQFIIIDDRVGINHNHNPIPFWAIFSDKFKYVGWKGKVNIHSVNDPDVLVSGSSDESIEHMIEFQEERCDVIQGFEKVAVEPPQINAENEEAAKEKFTVFIKMVCRDLCNTADKIGLTKEYLEYKNRLFEKVLQMDDFNIQYVPVIDSWYQPNVIYNFI